MANKRMLRTAVTMAVAVVVLVALWEGYKWVGDQTGGTWPGTTVDLPVTSNDITMPHVATSPANCSTTSGPAARPCP